MNPLNLITQPVRDLSDAFLMPFKALFVVGLCALINQMTTPGHWWFQWVALGMGIAVLVAWARAFKTLVLLVLLYVGGRWLHQRYGGDARQRFDDWAARTQPQASDVAQKLRDLARPAV